jgi:hypothetical protein
MSTSPRLDGDLANNGTAFVTNPNAVLENKMDDALIPPSLVHAMKQIPEKHRKPTEGDLTEGRFSELPTIVEFRIAILRTVDAPPD